LRPIFQLLTYKLQFNAANAKSRAESFSQPDIAKGYIFYHFSSADASVRLQILWAIPARAGGFFTSQGNFCNGRIGARSAGAGDSYFIGSIIRAAQGLDRPDAARYIRGHLITPTLEFDDNG
jgi:hypothetical protein